jgi:hypothetical protein
MKRFACALFVAFLFASREARAAGPIGAQGSPVTTSQYTVDLCQGPVLASSRITGMGGVYVPLGEGVDGNPLNPAAPAMRVPWSTSDLDWAMTAGITFASSLAGTDFYNTGTGATQFTYANFFFLTGGLTLQKGPWGLGASVALQQYNLGQSQTGVTIPHATLRLARIDVPVARSFFDGQLTVGIGPRGVVMGLVDATDPTSEQELFTMSGVGLQGGVVWSPFPVPIRIGVVGRTSVNGSADTSNRIQPDPNSGFDLCTSTCGAPGNVYLPNKVELPWEVEAGIAWQLGPRPLNIPWRNPKDVSDEELGPEVEVRDAKGNRELRSDRVKKLLLQRYFAVPRRKVLLLASLLVTGPTSNAVGLESFLSQQVDRSGQRVSLTPRAGVEAEIIPSWLQLRAGSYYEPTRFNHSSPRLHGTAGFDQKLFPWTVFGLFDEGTWWRAAGCIDYARDYLGWGATVGVWW